MTGRLILQRQTLEPGWGLASKSCAIIALASGQGPETRSTSPATAPISCDIPTTTPTGPGESRPRPTESPPTFPAAPPSSGSNESTPCRPPVCDPSTRSTDSVTATCSSGLCTVPTQGDGRCFFRAIVIALNPDLQASERNLVTGEILEELKTIQETARADNLRSMAILHVCQTLHMEPCVLQNRVLVCLSISVSTMLLSASVIRQTPSPWLESWKFNPQQLYWTHPCMS